MIIAIQTIRIKLNSRLVAYLRSHFKIKQISGNKHQCSLYGKAFKCNSSLQVHLRTHTSETPFSCAHCDYKCAQKGNLKVHLLRIHTEETPFSCDLCEFKTANKRYLKVHKLNHSGFKTLSCTQCEYKSAFSSHMKLHTRRTHTTDRPFACNLCEYKSASSSDLKIHQQRHSGEKNYIYVQFAVRGSFNAVT